MSTESPHMDKDTEVNVMSVDLAIRRELAYREKVAKLQSDGDADFMKNLLPLQVQNCSPHRHQIGLLSPSPISISRPNSCPVTLPLSNPTPPVGEPHSVSFSRPSLAPMQEPPWASSLQQRKPEVRAAIPRFNHMVSGPNLTCFPNANPRPPTSLVLNPPNQIPSANPNPRPPRGLNCMRSNPPNQIPSNPRLPPSWNQFPRQNTSLAPRPGHSGINRKTIGSVQDLPPRYPRKSFIDLVSVDQVGNFFCKACQVPCSGALSLKQHLKGHKHKAKLQWLQMGKKEGEEQGSMSCDLCGIWCTDENAMESHLKGQKHKAKLQELELGQGSGREERPFCEVCQIWCMNEDSLQMHLKGQKHISKLDALHKKKRGNGR